MKLTGVELTLGDLFEVMTNWKTGEKQLRLTPTGEVLAKFIHLLPRYGEFPPHEVEDIIYSIEHS